ncbi:MAG: hypothetical protein WCG27_08815 [Pseudomonadota bacterium]
MKKKILIIRLSSFGDIVQCLFIIDQIKKSFPQGEIHWVARDDMTSLLGLNSAIDCFWPIKRGSGLLEVIRTSWNLHQENFDFVYDAHSTIRSKVLILSLFVLSLFNFQILKISNCFEIFLFIVF